MLKAASALTLTPIKPNHMKNVYSRYFLYLMLAFSGSFSLIRPAAAQISVTATAGTTGPTVYTTLKGAFDAVNAGTHQGSITVTVTGSTTETAMAVLNASGSGGANYTALSLKPANGTSPEISGSVGSGPLVRLYGANNVTIDGSNNGSSSRDLLITNTNTNNSNVLAIGSNGSTPIDNVTVRNCVLTNGTTSSTALFVGDGAVIGNPGYFSNITLQNNDVRTAFIGIYTYAVVSALNNNLNISNNTLNNTGANAIRLVGIYAQGVNNGTISGNTVGNFSAANAEFDRGIWLATACKNITVSNNTVSGLSYTGTSSYAPIGINISSGISNANITVQNNAVSNFTSSGTGYTTGIYVYGALSGINIANNQISNIKNSNAAGYGAAGIILAPSGTTSNIKVFNNFIWDITGTGYNGYALNDNGNGIVIDGGGGYDINFNTIWLNTNPTLTGGHKASCLLVSSNVSASGAISLRNNILANTQTTGNAESRLTVSNLATSGSGVFSSINYNNYYSTSGNLSSTGTNASITTTLAQLQTSLGGNGNATVLQPHFMGANDLHLDPNYSNLNNTGTPVAGITTDIDGDTRNGSTPDAGADEYSPCATVTFSTPPAAAVVCAEGDTSFTVTATNATLYQWQVDEGSGFTDISNNTVYSGATTATLQLSNVPLSYSGNLYRCRATSIAACNYTNSSSATLTVNSLPAVPVSPANPAMCPGGSVTLSAPASGYTYQWLQGSSPAPAPSTGTTYSATANGNYSVIATSTTTGCSDTSAPVTVTTYPALTATQNVSICASQLPYTWNGQTVNAAGTAVASYTTPSLVTGCDSTTTLNLTTTATLFATQSITICANQLPYTWNGHIVNAGGMAASSDTTTSSAGCDSITTLNLTVNPLLSATAGLTICQSQLPYTWNGLTVSSGGTAAATYTTPSLVTGCDSTTTLNLTVNPNPVLSATPLSPSVCSGTATNISLSSSISGSSIAWTVTQTGATGGSAGSGSSIAQTLTASGNTPGQVIYTVTATANGCAATPVKDTVTVNPLPGTVATPASQTICSGTATNIALTSPVSGATFSWIATQTNVTGAGSGNGTTIAQTLTAGTPAAGSATYTAKATANGCTGSNTNITVTVNPVPAAPVAITGADEPCVGSTQVYTVATVPAAANYIWILPAGWTGTSTTNTITVTVGSTNGSISAFAANACGTSPAATKAVNPLPVTTPVVSISNNAPPLLCSGTVVTFTAAATSGGSTPVYQWKVNGNIVGNSSNSYSYQPSDEDTVSCTLTSNAPCVSSATANSNIMIMDVTPSVHPTLNIYVEENHICAESPVHFIATPANGGSSPAYQWKVNNSNTGSNSAAFSYTPANGDQVTCLMTSNAVCASPVNVLSNMVPMSITPVTHPAISLTANPPGNVANGTTVTFTASPEQGGSNFQVTWYKNDAYMNGVTGNSWSGIAGTDFVNGTRIQARIQSFSPCADPDTAGSNILKMSVGTTGIGNTALPEGFRMYPNPTTGQVTIEGLRAGDELSVYSALGHRLLQQEVRQLGLQHIDLSSFAQGMYWVRFSGKDGAYWQVSLVKR